MSAAQVERQVLIESIPSRVAGTLSRVFWASGFLALLAIGPYESDARIVRFVALVASTGGVAAVLAGWLLRFLARSTLHRICLTANLVVLAAAAHGTWNVRPHLNELPWIHFLGTLLVAIQGLLFLARADGTEDALAHEDLAASRGVSFARGWFFFLVVFLPTLWLEERGVSAAFLLALVAATFQAMLTGWPRKVAMRLEAATARTRIAADRALWFSLLALPFAFLFLSLFAALLAYPRIVSGVFRFEPELFRVFAAGLGLVVGGWLAGRWSEGRVETGWIPLGTGLQVLGLSLWFASSGSWFPVFFAFLVGLGLAWVLLPLELLLRWRGPRAGAFRVAAIALLVAALGSLSGGLLAEACRYTYLHGRDLESALIVVMGGLAIAGTAVALWLLPSAFLRALAYLVTHTIYRMRVLGARHVPLRGACVLAPNHVSFADAMFVMAATDRNVRFIAEEETFDSWIFGPLLRMNRAIPISSRGGARQILQALREAGQELERGSTVCLFPEGQITRTGAMQPFRRGLERLVKGRDAVIVPVHLDGVWGSIFSFSGARFFWKLPEEIPYPVTVSFGAPLPSQTPVAVVRDAVQELSQRAWQERLPRADPLHRLFARRVRRAPWRLLLVDSQGKRVRRLQALAGALALARHFRSRWSDTERVGVLLPPSVAAALVNAACAFAGKVVCNLNYTAGPAGLLSAARQARFREVLTSRAFLEKGGIALPEGLTPVFLEDEAPKIRAGTRILALLLALFAPCRLLERFAGCRRRVSGEAVATVLFSSGSTGEPKGVMLSHFNVASNVGAVAQVFRVEKEDRLLGILPFFHSFGTLSLWFSLTRGVPLVMHANPIDAPAVGHLVREHGVTILLATPTFLQVYLRRVEGDAFGSLRLVLAGAEKLSNELALAFEERFGVRPLEGYGTTECSPVVATSIPSHRARGFYQRGSRRGFVGPPLPGVALRILDPETGERLGPNQSGMLEVKGPNVMVGYLGREDLTREVLRDGWYATGDVAEIDEEGFLRIQDRLSRFAKIGGEMIPHGTIEEALHQGHDPDSGEQVFCVTSVPDERKGERLVVLHRLGSEWDPTSAIEHLRQRGFSNLFLPRKESFHAIAEIPRLGTGKTDLRAVKELAREREGERNTP